MERNLIIILVNLNILNILNKYIFNLIMGKLDEMWVSLNLNKYSFVY